jgi:transcriptional regulator with XRE-family HTH domain
MINEYSSRLKLILQSENVSIADFCRIIGLNSTGTIHKLIADNRKPSSKTVERIIAAFPKVTAEWLLYGRGSYGETPKQKLSEDDLTLTASQVIHFIKHVIPKHIDQRDNQTTSILLEKMNDIENDFTEMAETQSEIIKDHVEKFEGYEASFEDASFLLQTLVERVTVLENYALLTLDEKSKLRAKKDKENKNK